MLQTTLYLTKELVQQIDHLAASLGQPKAKIIRDALSTGLQKIQAPHSTSAQALLELAKIGGKGPADLAKRHNEYTWD